MTIREQVFYMFRRHDIELAEAFIRRCTAIPDIYALNSFFLAIFARMDIDTTQERAALDDEVNLSTWIQQFEQHQLPTLIAHRFPPLGGSDLVPFYGTTHRVCPA